MKILDILKCSGILPNTRDSTERKWEHKIKTKPFLLSNTRSTLHCNNPKPVQTVGLQFIQLLYDQNIDDYNGLQYVVYFQYISITT